MAESTTTATVTDIFEQQEKTISLLYDVLKNNVQGTQQPVYVTAAQPAQQAKAAPNYLLWILLGIGGFFIAKKAKLI